jgi:hypothetical protein
VRAGTFTYTGAWAKRRGAGRNPGKVGMKATTGRGVQLGDREAERRQAGTLLGDSGMSTTIPTEL